MKLIAGPCALESVDHALECAHEIHSVAQKYDLEFYFKTSFDKANRTSGRSKRGAGIGELLKAFDALQGENIKTLTDIHEPWQAKVVADVTNVIQIPALLSRQTDLILAAAKAWIPSKHGQELENARIVNIKKGQFMDPHAMREAVQKTKWVYLGTDHAWWEVHGLEPQPDFGGPPVWITERGTSFGYNNLVVDYRSLVIMKKENPGCDIIFDATHSVQLPSAGGATSLAQREFALPLARAAVAVGVDGLFVETHPDPDNAPSDGPNMIPLGELDEWLDRVLA